PTEYIYGAEGEAYTTSVMDKMEELGYELTETPAQATGVFGKDKITVEYVYNDLLTAAPPTEEVDKSKLQAAVDEASAFLESINKEDYGQDAIDAVQAALDNANAVVSVEDVDQETVDAALQRLEAAMDQLYNSKKDDSTRQPGDNTPSGGSGT